ncbi:MAG: hypothetical protein VR68_00695 [Peptococcaceae bacterium BRH_c4a]|nr:MAG: hypothetical protein VR68_00695 [Peptococcaceae bacterium BRH_c4a]
MLNEIKRLVHETMELPLLIEETEKWRNEMNDILNEVSKKRNKKDLYESVHEQFFKALNESERLKNCLQGNISILNLCAAFINSGKAEQLGEILSPVAQVKMSAENPEKKTEELQGSKQEEHGKDEGLEINTFTVLEVKGIPEEGTRAWCKMPDGQKIAVYSEGETAAVFLNAKGLEVKARVRRIERGLFAEDAKKLA